MSNYIEDSKVISTIEKFYNSIDIVNNSKNSSKDEIETANYFIDAWELNLAKAILYEFGEVHAKRVANAILAIVDEKHF